MKCSRIGTHTGTHTLTHSHSDEKNSHTHPFWIYYCTEFLIRHKANLHFPKQKMEKSNKQQQQQSTHHHHHRQHDHHNSMQTVRTPNNIVLNRIVYIFWLILFLILVLIFLC